MRRIVTKLMVTTGALAVAGTMFLAPTSVLADEREIFYDAKSCIEGGIATTARANGGPIHRVEGNYRTFNNSGATFLTTIYYSGVKNMGAGKGSIETGGAPSYNIASKSIRCDF
jgi:hypothetical protein